MSKVRGGQVFVEIGADPRKLFKAFQDIGKHVGKLGQSMQGLGTRMAAFGTALAAPIAMAVRSGAKFEDVLLSIRASTGATAAQLDQIKSASMAMSAALGVGPTEAAGGFLELLKAGMSVEQVLGGAGKAAIQFAKVGEMAVADAAVVMADAMAVFKVSGDTAANTLSAAADASSTSIQGIAQAFAQVSAVASLANQSIGDTAAGLAVLANAGVKGSDAGTSLKTMLMRLMAPSSDAVGAMEEIGLSVQSFRNADGTVKPLVDIIGTLTTATKGLDQAARDDIFAKIFGQDAIRAAAVLTQAGVEGFSAMTAGMGEANTVGDKFATMSSGLSGSAATMLAALERLSLTISDALAPSLAKAAEFVTDVITSFTNFVKNNEALVVSVAKNVAIFGAAGGAMFVFGSAISFASGTTVALASGVATVLSPMRMLVTGVAGVGSAFASVVPSVVGFGVAVGNSTVSAGVSVARFVGQATSSLAGFGIAGVRSVGQFASALQGSLRVAVSGVAPAVAYAAKGLVALASDATRLIMPLTAPFFSAAGAAATFAASVAGSVTAYVSSIAAAAAATVTNNARIATAWAGSALQSVWTFVAGVASGMATYVASVAAAVTASVASAAGIAAAWIATAFPATTAFVAGSVTKLGTYIASTAAALAASVSSAAGIAVAWIASGMPGLLSFVGAAVAGLASYVGSCAVAAVSSMASAAAVAAAWLAPLAPLLAIGAAIAGVVVIAGSIGGKISGAFAGVGAVAQETAGAIGTGFSAAVSSAGEVLSRLFSTATTTFAGIREALADGDYAGAMQMLWLGAQAATLRGTAAIMGVVDDWVAFFQNTFTYLGTSIAASWDSLWTTVSGGLNVAGAAIFGVVDNIVNTIMAAFDTMVATVRKSWNWVQSFIRSGYDLAEENKKVDDEMAARARQREMDRPGVSGRVERANQENEQAAKESAQRIEAMQENANRVAQGRYDTNRQNADRRNQEATAMEADVGKQARGRRETRVKNEQVADLLKNLENANSLDQLRDLWGEIESLQKTGRITDQQYQQLETAFDDASERVFEADRMAGNARGKARDNAAAAAGQAGKGTGEVAGTFSAAAVGQMGFGTNLAQKQLQALEKIEKNTRDKNEGVIGD